jgi:hypothetical protein
LSLLPLAGMFIFGGKKKKADERSEREEYERKLEELSKRYGIPKENIKEVALFRVYNGGQARILQKAVGIPEKKLFEVLDARYTIPDKHIFIASHHEKKWHERSREPYRAHLAQIHPILAVAAAEHTKTYTREVGHAIGDAIDRIYKEGIYLELKKDPTPLIDAIYEELTERGIPISDTKKFYEDMEKVFRVASKIADKIVIMDKDPKTIETAATIMAGHVEDPVSKLKELGIDITPELEELKQVFAEISGKKAQKPHTPKVPKETSPDLSKEAAKLLGLLRGLKYARYSREAVDAAKKELEAKIEALIIQIQPKLVFEFFQSFIRYFCPTDFPRGDGLAGNPKDFC